ncbi:hypothetical protein ACM66B_001554 [Microbotryomycetes sp. NB124-2]
MSCQDSELGKLLSAHGGGFHACTEFKQDAVTGTSVYATADIPAHETIAVCPNRLAVTPALCRSQLDLLRVELSTWTDHELMTTYLALHVVTDVDRNTRQAFKLEHYPYVNLLPKQDLLTPTNFSGDELELLKGTNLYAATLERRDKWKQEWQEVIQRHESLSVIEWSHYSWACTMISSRAFPSRVVDGDDSDPTPILLPGVDMLNHDLSSKVTWRTSEYTNNGAVSLVVESATQAGSQIFNNYGPKPNEEFMLGYGFLPRLDQRVGDVVALRTSLPPQDVELIKPVLTRLELDETLYFIKQDGVLPVALRNQMRVILAVQAFVDNELEIPQWTAVPLFVSWETELDMLSMFQAMLTSKLTSVMTEPLEQRGQDVRPQVRVMCREYRQGQQDILLKAIELLEQEFQTLLDKAKQEGFDTAEYEEDDSEDEGEGEGEAQYVHRRG